jgi:hypothetical protein
MRNIMTTLCSVAREHNILIMILSHHNIHNALYHFPSFSDGGVSWAPGSASSKRKSKIMAKQITSTSTRRKARDDDDAYTPSSRPRRPAMAPSPPPAASGLTRMIPDAKRSTQPIVNGSCPFHPSDRSWAHRSTPPAQTVFLILRRLLSPHPGSPCDFQLPHAPSQTARGLSNSTFLTPRLQSVQLDP